MLESRLEALAVRRSDPLVGPFPRGDSAVLVLVVLGGDAGIVLVRRAATLSTDPGFVAFPGGRLDPGEQPEAAARRECHEEVGIPAADVTVHGRLDETWNGAGFRIIPVVGSIRGPRRLTPFDPEVAAAATVPLGLVLGDANHDVVTTTIEGYDHRDDRIRFDHRGQEWELFGPTADVARDLAA